VRRSVLALASLVALGVVHDGRAHAQAQASAAASLVPTPTSSKPPEPEATAPLLPKLPEREVSAPATPSPPPPKRAHKPKRRAPKAPPAVAAELFALNTHESFKLRPDAGGRFGRKELRGWNRFLRCHHTGRQHVMSPRLASLIYEVAKHFDYKRILVVAGYRAPRVAREKGNPKSPHKAGLACDFRVEGVANTELRDYVRSAFAKVGVGYYPNSEFVHLDVRAKVSAFWIDYSRPGERARYSKSPATDLEEERASSEGGEPQAPAESGAPAPEPTPPSAPTPQAP
jgi:uncharacterized protein YcbK (DUF882 family)